MRRHFTCVAGYRITGTSRLPPEGRLSSWTPEAPERRWSGTCSARSDVPFVDAGDHAYPAGGE